MFAKQPFTALTARVPARSRRAARRSARRWTTCLAVELLEDRTVLSAFLVTNPNDSGDGSLRWAVNAANESPGADTIQFDPGIFIPGMSIPLTSGQISLTDTSGTTTIDGRGAYVTVVGSSNSRVFTVGAGASADFYSLTIAGGHAVYNGSDYMTGNGGGIFNLGDLTVSGCILSNNSAKNEGGGIYNGAASRLTVLGGTMLTRNSANFGGGIASRGELTVSSSSISYNTTAQNGGGIGNAVGVLTVSASTISHNTSGNTGGAIFSSGPMTVSASTVSYNNAFSGGAMYLYDDTTISASTLSGNAATDSAGGIFVASDLLQIHESTIVNNSAPVVGGIANTGSTPAILKDSLVAGNFQGNSTPYTPSDLVGAFDVGSAYNLIGDGSGGLSVAKGNLLGTASKPLDPLLGPLQNNGGLTWTHAPLAGSPAINAGDPTFLATPDVYDQRGLGFPRVVGGRIDIGALEVQVLTSHHLVSLATAVSDLVRQDVLPPGLERSVSARVDVAHAQLDRGNTMPVVKMLEAFIHQVGGLTRAGKLSNSEAQYLIDLAEHALDSIGDE